MRMVCEKRLIFKIMYLLREKEKKKHVKIQICDTRCTQQSLNTFNNENRQSLVFSI